MVLQDYWKEPTARPIDHQGSRDARQQNGSTGPRGCVDILYVCVEKPAHGLTFRSPNIRY